MDFKSRMEALPEVPRHKRTTSEVLKSVMPRTHQRTPTSSTPDWQGENENSKSCGDQQRFMLPPDHPNTRGYLRENSGNRNQGATSPRKSADPRKENIKGFGERPGITQSVSLSSFASYPKPTSPKKKSGKEEDKPMKKSKSSTGLSALLSRPKSSKALKKEDARQKKDKENQTPPTTADIAPPPIWAQFATQAIPKPGTSKVPLNDRKSLDEEIALYTPQAYSPSKQRDFSRPTLSGRSESKPRPKSECIAPRPTKESFAETVSGLRKPTRSQVRTGNPGPGQPNTDETNEHHDRMSTDKSSDPRSSQEHRKDSHDSSRTGLPTSKRGSRVMAAVAAFNGKTKGLPEKPSQHVPEPGLDPQAIESAFESLLVSTCSIPLLLWLTSMKDARNVPQNTRDKMRSLDTNIKADFIHKDKFGLGSASSTEGLSMQHSRPNTGRRSKTDEGTMDKALENFNDDPPAESPRKARPRSRTFTFNKGDQSPSKKQKSERPKSHQRNKSGDLTPSGSSKSLTSSGAAQGMAFFSKTNRRAVPEDFLLYLRKVQQPEKVEVGRIHKLKQLLRNETVGWVDTFITQGGMVELVELLYRIIKVEWRVEHEDALLHETLLCLKAISTTSSALAQISDMAPTLFPTLLNMLFDKEKKGPSEFTTRNIIITLLTTYLTSSPSLTLADRARLILTYLRDPPEETQAPAFITSIYHPRPYRIWNRELDSVVKEVFWIFLHHCNIIPYPDIPASAATYIARHFPREHPPVAAAPYIGGVEWDVTNYLTAHIDLLNGLVAALPEREERNALRMELKDSGFERVMGVSLRTCKEKFYGCVHESLSVWVGAAREDGWEVGDVRQGPKQEQRVMSPNKSPKKKDQAPVLEMPKLDLGGEGRGGDEGGWL